MYLEETIIQKDICTPMFIATLFTIVRTWKQPKYPSAEEWITKMWNTYTMDYYSAIRNKTMPFAVTWIDLCCAVLSRSVVCDSETPWTVAHQAPLSMGILQARILEWVAMPSSGGYSQPRNRIQVSG